MNTNKYVVMLEEIEELETLVQENPKDKELRKRLKKANDRLNNMIKKEEDEIEEYVKTFDHEDE